MKNKVLTVGILKQLLAKLPDSLEITMETDGRDFEVCAIEHVKFGFGKGIWLSNRTWDFDEPGLYLWTNEPEEPTPGDPLE